MEVVMPWGYCAQVTLAAKVGLRAKMAISPPPPKSLLHVIGKFSVPWFWSCINLFLLEGVYVMEDWGQACEDLRAEVGHLPEIGEAYKHGMSLSLSLQQTIDQSRARRTDDNTYVLARGPYTYMTRVVGGGYANNGTLSTLISPRHRDSFLLYNLCYYFYMTLHCTLLYCQNDTVLSEILCELISKQK